MSTQSMKKCVTCEGVKPLDAFRKNRHRCKKCNHDLHLIWAKQNPIKIMLQSAKHRAKRDGLPFSLTVYDITIPDVCPVLGYKLISGDRHNHDFAPTIDRLKPELGYVPGNIIIISCRANRIKNDATADELRRVAYYSQNGLEPDIKISNEVITEILKPFKCFTFTSKGPVSGSC